MNTIDFSNVYFSNSDQWEFDVRFILALALSPDNTHLSAYASQNMEENQ